MGTGRHLRPLRVHQIASRMLETGRLQAEPPWYRVVGNVPPTTSLVRTLPVKLQEKRLLKSHRKMPGLYRPHRIVYPEDKLRQRFFRDHPWELARPRIVVENDGRDHERYDWSKMMQPGKRLDGESVVQRQQWLMENEGLDEEAAYDKARKEFYDLRMQEDIERRVTAEEARATGAKFGKSYIEIGLQLEGEMLEDWKKKAIALLQLKAGQRAAFQGGTGEAADEDEVDLAAAPLEDAIEEAAPTPVVA